MMAILRTENAKTLAKACFPVADQYCTVIPALGDDDAVFRVRLRIIHDSQLLGIAPGWCPLDTSRGARSD